MEYLILFIIFFGIGVAVAMGKACNKSETIITGVLLGVIGLVLSWIKIVIIGSLITSSVKGIAGSCDRQYPVENYFYISGNWFCSKEKL